MYYLVYMKFSPTWQIVVMTFALLGFRSFTFAAETCHDWIGSAQLMETTLQVVEESMKSAGILALEIQRERDFELQTKAHAGDLKTKADCGSQNLIFRQLSQNTSLRQTAIFKGEEKCQETNAIVESSKSKNGGSGAFWLLDPVDGTTNLVQGDHYFSISLALVVNQQICFGVVYAPAYHEFYYAFQGQGTHLKDLFNPKGKTIHVSKTDLLKNVMWYTGTEGGSSDPKAVQKNEDTFEVAKVLLPKTRDLRRHGSAALDLASIAVGKADAYFEFSQGLNFWDIAAGILLVQEAGGKVDLVFEEALASSLKKPSVSLTTENQGKIDLLEEERVNETQSNTELSKRRLSYILATNGQTKVHEEFKVLLNQRLRLKR